MAHYSGHCLCQAVSYHFDCEPISAVHCHCSDCQKATGSGFATVFSVPEAAISISGQEHLTAFAVQAPSGKRVQRSFCKICGSPLFTHAESNPGYIWIKAGSLTESSWLKPQIACWTGSAASWAPAIDNIPQFQGNP